MTIHEWSVDLSVPLPPENLSLAPMPFSFAALIVTIPIVERRLKRLQQDDS